MKWDPMLSKLQTIRLTVALIVACLGSPLLGQDASRSTKSDPVRKLQRDAIVNKTADWGRWGGNPNKYSSWTNHSNRIVPVYTFGMTLDAYSGSNSVYRDRKRLTEIYGRLPEQTLNPSAEYFDQTEIHTMLERAAANGKKYIFLVVFDGMDWQTTLAAATVKTGTPYKNGRGSGLHFLDYRCDKVGYGGMVTSPHNAGTKFDVDSQTVSNPGGEKFGGFSAKFGGSHAWSKAVVHDYLIGRMRDLPHVFTDSASSATSMNTGIKTFNGAINMAPDGRQVVPFARRLQSERGYAIGVVSSVPISHATPAAVYANNVSRSDYQDLTRDLLGLPSVCHRDKPLSGVDVLIGCGWGESRDTDKKQGNNFVPGNKYLTAADLKKSDAEHGGKYRFVQRTPGQPGDELLLDAAKDAAKNNQRLLGFFGVTKGHLPYQTADGDFDPTPGVNKGERYSPADIEENPSLQTMTRAALEVLESYSDKGFYLMVEPGDVDWAAHDNNLDNAIGAVFSGDDAVRAITTWIDSRDAWNDSVLIITADHGHYLQLDRPSVLTGAECPDSDAVSKR